MKYLIRFFFTLVLLYTTNVSAVLITDSSTKIIGVTGITVLGASYDVTLHETIADWSDSGVGNYDWTFAMAASAALLDIFETGYLSGSSYDSDPASAFGCTNTTGQCNWLTAVGINFRGGRDATGTVFTNAIDLNTVDTSTRIGAPTTADYNTDYTNITFLTWTKVGAVPEPSIIALIGVGLFGLAFARKRIRN